MTDRHQQHPQTAPSLYVNDLPVNFGERELYNLFSPLGTILRAEIVVRGKETCTARVDFAKFEAAIEALHHLQGYCVQGRKLSLKLRQNDGGAPLGQRRTKEVINSIYVRFEGNFPEPVTFRILNPIFNRFGVVTEVSVKDATVDTRTGRQSGLAFVHYDSTPQGLQSALQAISVMDGMSVEGIYFKVEPSRNLIKQFDQNPQLQRSVAGIEPFNRLFSRSESKHEFSSQSREQPRAHLSSYYEGARQGSFNPTNASYSSSLQSPSLEWSYSNAPDMNSGKIDSSFENIVHDDRSLSSATLRNPSRHADSFSGSSDSYYSLPSRSSDAIIYGGRDDELHFSNVAFAEQRSPLSNTTATMIPTQADNIPYQSMDSLLHSGRVQNSAINSRSYDQQQFTHPSFYR
eukprot:scaffold1508_cov182-Ochromonas_danica.AAC.9